MAQDESKTGEDKVTIYYWGVNFRGHFSKLILEAAGVNYTVVKDYKGGIDALVSGPIENRPYPTFAVPIVKVEFADKNKETFYTSQMPAGAQYLAKKYGLEPESAEDACHAIMIVMNCNDILVEITRDNGNQMWDIDAWTKWRNDRLIRWFKILQGLLMQNQNNKDNSDNIYYFGTKLSYADLAVYHILQNFIEVLYPNNNEWIKKDFAMLYKLYSQVSKIDAIAKFTEKQKGWPFCGGQIEKSIKAVIKEELEKQAK